MIISSRLFGAFLECSTKCWLRSIEPGTNNSYADWANQRNETYLESRLRHAFVGIPESDRAIAPTIPNDPKDANWRLAINAHWITKYLESRLQAVERIPAKGLRKHSQFIPYRFEFVNKLTKEHKLLLAFDALLLSEALGSEVSFGRIVHGDSHNSLKVKTHAFAAEVRKRIKQITALLTSQSAPDLVLNRHCGQCAYRTQCSARAKETDELSLLSDISQNDRKNFRAKGIFTVTQLSYTFRPRHRRKNSRDSPEKNHHSLRALAIRENKIHAVGAQNLELAGNLVFLDVEGLPDRDFYYLIGIRIQAAKENVQHSFWADDLNGEALIWQQFLGVLSAITNPHLIHYGNYEAKFLKRMCDRHGRPPAGSMVAAAIDHPTNLLSFIYAKIYFPTHSNGLKEIAGYLGFHWSGPLTSGIESIVWRHRWEDSRDPALKENLQDYNRQDCEALDLLANKLIDLSIGFQNRASSATGEVALTSNMKGRESYRFKRNEFVFPEMEDINQAAYWDYQRERVYVKSPDRPPPKRRGHPTHRRSMTPNTTIEYSRPPSCPSCKSMTIYMHGRRSRIVIDLRFMRHGIKRWVIRHIGRRYRCPSCGRIIHPHDRPTVGSRFGPNLVAYTIYQNIELRLPQNRIALSVNKIFGLD
jgi:predicted RecB family nuclease